MSLIELVSYFAIRDGQIQKYRLVKTILNYNSSLTASDSPLLWTSSTWFTIIFTLSTKIEDHSSKGTDFPNDATAAAVRRLIFNP